MNFSPIREAITVRIGFERVGMQGHLRPIGQAVAIRIRIMRIGRPDDILAIAQTVAVRIGCRRALWLPGSRPCISSPTSSGMPVFIRVQFGIDDLQSVNADVIRRRSR